METCENCEGVLKMYNAMLYDYSELLDTINNLRHDIKRLETVCDNNFELARKKHEALLIAHERISEKDSEIAELTISLSRFVL